LCYYQFRSISNVHDFEEADMTVVKEKIKAKNGVLHMNLPDEFKDKMVEVVVKLESEIEKKLMIDTIRIDTSKWKFNRDEIYG
jgi:hypothetical protein